MNKTFCPSKHFPTQNTHPSPTIQKSKPSIMNSDQSFKPELTRSRSPSPRRQFLDDVISRLATVLSPSPSPMTTTAEEFVPPLHMYSFLLTRPTRPKGKEAVHAKPAASSTDKPFDPALAATKAKSDEERRQWCAAFDAAQPTGRSLSVKDEEFLELLRVFRDGQPKKFKPEIIDDGVIMEEQTQVKQPRVKKNIISRMLVKLDRLKAIKA